MGLKEKRIIEAYKREHFPKWQQRINTAYGDHISIEVDWDKMVKEFKEGYDHPKSIDYAFFVPLEKAFIAVGFDDMGREALREKVKIVKITSSKPTNNMQIRLEEGVLLLDVEPPLIEHPDHRYAERITEILEESM